MTRSNRGRYWRFAGCLLGAGAASLPLIAAAQTAKPDDKVAEMETVEVTGSRIRRTDYETASPIQLISRDDIERSGKQNIAELIRSISADNQGSVPTAFSSGFAAGAAAVSLRGLGVNSTLVLLNGRRMATYGLADDGSRTFVDLNSIPLEAVERIEVLKDGASAIYGSDAIGGVVNVILRKDYRGTSIGGNFGTSYMDDGDYTRLHGSYGFGNERYNAFFTIEGSTSDAIAQTSRPEYLGTNNLTDFGWYDNRNGSRAAGLGNYAFFDLDGELQFSPALLVNTPYGTVRPLVMGPEGTMVGDPDLSHRLNLAACPEISQATGVCLFDTMRYNQIQPEQDRINLLGRGSVNIVNGLQAYLEAGYFFTKTAGTGTPGGVNDNGVFNPADPGNLIVHTTTLPGDHPDNPYRPIGRSRTLSLLTTDLGGRDGEQENGVLRLITGLTGDFSGWNWDVGAGYIRSELDESNTGYVHHANLQEALNDGTYRPGRPDLTPQSVRDAISPTLKRTGKNEVTLLDGDISGSLFDLPGGSFGIAVGAEWRNEKTDTPPLPFTDTGDIVGLGYSAFKADRDVYAGYVELSAPVLKMLELNAALRYDHYSDYGSSTTPKVGFKFKPLDQLALRGTYAEAFRAPGPAENGNSSTYGFTGIGLLTIGNPDIRPESAKSYTLGLVTEPVRGLTATLDYYHIQRDDEIVSTDQATVIGDAPLSGQEPGSTRPGALPNSTLYYDINGDLAAAAAPYVNANKTTTAGLDFDVRQRFDFNEYGKLSMGLMLTHIITFEREFESGDSFEYAGTHGPYVLSAASGTPADKAQINITWERGPLTVSGIVNYVSGMDLIDHEGSELVDGGDGTWSTDTYEGSYYVLNPDGKVCGVYNPDGSMFNDCRVASFTTFDLFGKWEAQKNWEFTGSVQNLFNRLAPFDPYTYGGTNYNPSFHQSGAVGRFMTIGLKYTF